MNWVGQGPPTCAAQASHSPVDLSRRERRWIGAEGGACFHGVLPTCGRPEEDASDPGPIRVPKAPLLACGYVPPNPRARPRGGALIVV